MIAGVTESTGIMGWITVNPFGNVPLPPPGAGLVAVIVRAPSVALPEIVIFAVADVEELTEVLFTEIPAPKLNVVCPCTKPVPDIDTFSVDPDSALVGFTSETVG